VIRPPLADALALALVEQGPMPGSGLALKVRRRREDVLAELHANPRFERAGRGRSSRWQIDENAAAGPREHLGTIPGLQVGIAVAAILAARLEALEGRVAALERRNGSGGRRD
jgi:hypothetical protein